MFAYIYDNLYTYDVLTFVAMMSCYIPLYILLFKHNEESMSVEAMLVNKIRELEIENEELRAKLAPFDKIFEDEKLSLKLPLGDDVGDDVGDSEGDSEGDNEGDDDGDDEYESDE